MPQIDELKNWDKDKKLLDIRFNLNFVQNISSKFKLGC